MRNLIEGIQKECDRLRNDLIPQYQTIGSAGAIGIAFMKATIKTAEQAVASGDTVAMVRAYKELEGHTG